MLIFFYDGQPYHLSIGGWGWARFVHFLEVIFKFLGFLLAARGRRQQYAAENGCLVVLLRVRDGERKDERQREIKREEQIKRKKGRDLNRERAKRKSQRERAKNRACQRERGKNRACQREREISKFYK